MKILIKILIGFGLMLNINAQNIEITSFRFSLKDNTNSALNLDQKLTLMKELNIVARPQFGNLFINRLEAKKARISLKDYYDDFSFGFNLGLSWNIKKNVNFITLYNVGMLKFDKPDCEKVKGYIVQLSIDYAF